MSLPLPSCLANALIIFPRALPSYGPHGQKILRDAIHTCFIHPGLLTEARTTPLPVDAYVRRVLIPECAIELIRRDLAATRGLDPNLPVTAEARAEAERVCEQSRRFGVALHSTNEDMDAFAREEEERERKEREARNVYIVRLSSGFSSFPSPALSSKAGAD